MWDGWASSPRWTRVRPRPWWGRPWRDGPPWRNGSRWWPSPWAGRSGAGPGGGSTRSWWRRGPGTGCSGSPCCWPGNTSRRSPATAYSFSARGPIVSPRVDCLVVTPIAAHMVFDRSFVIGAGEDVTVEVRGEEPGLLSADGLESLPLPVGSRVRIRAADEPARVVLPPESQGFFLRVS